MPNRYQLAFLASFVGVFAGLVLLFNFVKAKLKVAGYDVSQLILIGLPQDETSTPPQLPSWLSSPNSNMFAQLLAIILAAVTSAAIYYKFGASTCILLVPGESVQVYVVTCQSENRC